MSPVVNEKTLSGCSLLFCSLSRTTRRREREKSCVLVTAARLYLMWRRFFIEEWAASGDY